MSTFLWADKIDTMNSRNKVSELVTVGEIQSTLIKRNLCDLCTELVKMADYMAINGFW